MRCIISRMEYSHRRSKHLAQKTILAKRDPWKITSNKTYSLKVFIVKIPRFCHKLTLLYPCNSQVAADPDKLCSCLRLELQRGWERAKVGHVRCTVKDTYHFNFLFICFVHLVCSFCPCLESFLQGGIQTYHWMQSGHNARHLLHPLEFPCCSKGSRQSLIPFAPQAMNSEVSPLLWSLRPDGNTIDVSLNWQVAVGWGPRLPRHNVAICNP